MKNIPRTHSATALCPQHWSNGPELNLQHQAGTKQTTKRGPIFRATKDQINQAQAILKERGFYGGEQLGKLDDATREGLRKYQQAEGLR